MAYSGPFKYVQESYGRTSSYSNTRKKYRQKTPYSALPYDARFCRTTFLPSIFGQQTNPGVTDITSAVLKSAPLALSKAYGKFVEEAKYSATLGVNLAERKQAIDMIASRSMKIFRFSMNLKSLRFVEAARELGFSVVKRRDSRRWTRMTLSKSGSRVGASLKGDVLRKYDITLKRNTKSFANNYLEFHFGWEPLMKDIGSGIDIINDVSGFSRKARGSAVVVTDTPLPSSWPVGSFASQITTKSRVLIQADVKTTNTTLSTLNQTGFINPAVIAWELVPFSFVVDWFTNIGQVLASYTDFVGMGLSNSFTTVSGSSKRYKHYCGTVSGETRTAAWTLDESFCTVRTLGVSAPTLVLKGIKLPSLTRALTATSLLAQFLRS